MKATIGSQGIGDGQFIYSSFQLIENGHRIQLQSDLWGPFLTVRKKESRSILLLFYQEGSPHSQATAQILSCGHGEKSWEKWEEPAWVRGSTNIKWPQQKSSMSYPLCILTLIPKKVHKSRSGALSKHFFSHGLYCARVLSVWDSNYWCSIFQLMHVIIY